MKGITIWDLSQREARISFGLFLCSLGGRRKRPSSGGPEPLVRYHSRRARILTLCVGLPKGNGGVQRFPRAEQRLPLKCKGRRELHCKTHPSSKDESQPY
ncbi:hypothetical protein V6Z11_A08G086600 [Gossypium hirsutum]